MNRRSLTRERVLRAALQVVDREGLEALTMRRVAKRLGSGTMTLYHYVPGKQALLQGILDLALGEIELPPNNLDWAERFKHLVRSVRRAILRHPELLPVLTTQQPTTPVALRLMQEAFAALRHGGFSPVQAAHVYRVVGSYTIGYLSLEIRGFFNPDGEGPPSALPGLLLQDFPDLLEVAPHLLTWDPDEQFEQGLQSFLDGLRAGTDASHLSS